MTFATKNSKREYYSMTFAKNSINSLAFSKLPMEYPNQSSYYLFLALSILALTPAKNFSLSIINLWCCPSPMTSISSEQTTLNTSLDLSISTNSARTINLVKKRADINIEGVLPCPIRIPLLESFQSWLKENKDSFDYTIGYELQSANLGLDWIKDQVKTGDVDQIPDVLMSAGFDLFFDKTLMGQFMDDDVFEAATDEFLVFS